MITPSRPVEPTCTAYCLKPLAVWRLWRQGFGCVAVSADPSGLVRITSTGENGPDLDLQELRADVIVGADGASLPCAARMASRAGCHLEGSPGGCKRRPGCCSASAASSDSRPCAYGTLCWRDWPGYRGSAKRPSVGASPPTSELLDRHPCSTRAEPPNRRPQTLRRRERRSESCLHASEISRLQDACVDLK